MDILSRIQKKLLPHISRIFSATDILSQFRFVLLASFLAFIALNAWMLFIYPNNLAMERINLLSAPFTANRHIVFGQQLYTQGNVKEATDELLLAEQVSAFPSPFSLFVPTVLGAQTEPTDLLNTWEKNRTYTLRAYQFWKATVEARPDYRDAFIALSMLCAKLDKHDEAVTYLKKAYVLDPNNGIVQELATQLGVLL